MDRIESLCVEKGMRMTEQRRVIARVLSALGLKLTVQTADAH